MMYEGLQMDIFVRELKNLLNSMVYKSNKLASKYETIDIHRKAEEYIKVRDGMDDFSSYVNFYPEVYEAAGITGVIRSQYLADKDKIPYALRESIIRLQREYILNNYEEKNDYYRNLSGLPPYGTKESEFIYVPENKYEVNTTTPIHLLDASNIARLRSSGLLKKIIKEHPDKDYLNHLVNRIDCYVARKAMNYDLLFISESNPENIGLEFRKFYSNAREYFMNAIYNNNLASSYKYYDNFIGFSITIMAVQRLFGSVFQQGITRDFYDTQLIRYLFDSYSIPYIEEMTLDQMKILAKNLNIFLSIKSSTKVLFDLCSIFGFSNVNIYKYLLVKDHIRDSVTGIPMFAEKTIAHEDGTFTTEPDYEKMFEIYFQKVNVKSRDVNTALEDKANKISYQSMTAGDIYWIDDENLRKKIYEANLNHIESKYISMDIMFKITEMMYEICHTFRMIIDNNKEFSRIKISVPRLSSRPQDLYSIIIFLCAIWCKRFKFTGEIPLKPASIAYVYGFNFHTDLNKIINDIYESKYIDNSVVKYLINFTVTSNRDVDRIYGNIKDLKDFIVEQMAQTKDIEVYRAYKALYNSVLVVEDKKEVYQKTDGTYAKTWIELLESINPELYTFLDLYDTSDDKAVVALMEHILYRLEDLSSRYKYLHTAVESNALFSVLIKLVKFFKSYTVDLSAAGILYLFDDRYFNMLKILDGLTIEVERPLETHLKALYMDMIESMKIKIPKEDKLKLYDWYLMYVLKFVDEYIHLRDKINLTEVLADVNSAILDQYADNYDEIIDVIFKESVKLDEKYTMYIKEGHDEYITLKELLTANVFALLHPEKVIGEYNDHLLPKVDEIRNDLLKLKSTAVYDITPFCLVKLRLRDILYGDVIAAVKTAMLDQYADNYDQAIESFKKEIIKHRDEISDGVVQKGIDEIHVTLKDFMDNTVKKNIAVQIMGEYSDQIHSATVYDIDRKTRLEMFDRLAINSHRWYFGSWLKMQTKIGSIVATMDKKDRFLAMDMITKLISEKGLASTVKFAEYISSLIHNDGETKFSFRDEALMQFLMHKDDNAFISEYADSISARTMYWELQNAKMMFKDGMGRLRVDLIDPDGKISLDDSDVDKFVNTELKNLNLLNQYSDNYDANPEHDAVSAIKFRDSVRKIDTSL